MKSILIFQTCLLLFFGSIACAQSSTIQENISYPSPDRAQEIIIPYSPELDDESFRKLLNKEFSKILNPKATSTIGNFAAIDLKEASVTAASTFNFKRGFLVVKAAGNATDGILSLVTDTKLNTGVELGAQFNWFVNSPNRHRKLTNRYPGNVSVLFDANALNYLQFDSESIDKYNNSLKEAKAKHRLSQYSRSTKIDSILLVLESRKLASKEAKIRSTIDTVNNKIRRSRSPQLSELLQQRRDSLEFESFKTQEAIEETETKIANYPTLHRRMRREATNTYILAEESAFANIKVTGARINWLSLSYSLKRSSFRLLDTTKSFPEQVTKDDFTGHTFRLQYSRYMYTNAQNKSYFWTIGLAPAITDNLADPSKKEVLEEGDLDPASRKRYILEKYNAYQGNYKSDRYAVSLFADYYKFLGQDNRCAIHIFPEHKIRENKLPTTNFGLGLLVAFQNQAKEKTIVNAELYANAANILGIGNPDTKLLKRGIAGLRFTFPIAFQ